MCCHGNTLVLIFCNAPQLLDHFLHWKRSSHQFEFEAATRNNVAEAGRSSSRASDDDENEINTRKNSDYINNNPLFLAEHDIDDAVGSEEPTERDHGVDLQQPLLIKIDSSDSHQK